MIDPTVSAGGVVGISFDRELRVPKFIKDAKKSRRNLQELKEINVGRDILTLELLVNSDESIMDFEYDIFIKSWTSKAVEFQVLFTNPLAISQDKLRDDFKMKIVDKSMYLSE
jgi:hypothetical protein